LSRLQRTVCRDLKAWNWCWFTEEFFMGSKVSAFSPEFPCWYYPYRIRIFIFIFNHCQFTMFYLLIRVLKMS
jgi:hypothetical protein